MRTLRQSLIDYELGLLKAIASRRAVHLESHSKNDIINQLVEVLLSPVNNALTLDSLSRDERTALGFIVNQGGQVDAPRFIRQYGQIRPMGPARLEREEPWRSPVNPAEGLWYLGLIFKAFQVSDGEGREIFYIPSDLINLIKPAFNHGFSSASFSLPTMSEPAHVIPSGNRLRENFFSLLVYLQTHPIRFSPDATIPDRDTEKLTSCLLPVAQPVVTELSLLLHIGQRANLLTPAHGKLRPNRPVVRDWLLSSSAHQVWMLQTAWRADPTWNDLWQVPGLQPQPTGWENSPLRARSGILSFLERLPANTWFLIDNLVTAIKQVDPDFQRPDGNYNNWYIQNKEGYPLMGFEYWDEVEGALIRYILTEILYALSVLDLGSDDPASPPVSFRITETGHEFLQSTAPANHPHRPTNVLRVDNTLQIRITPDVSLFDRFQVARFAQLDKREDNRVYYKITQSSVNRALKNGVTHDQIMAFLTRATNNQIPLKVVETLREWGTRFGTARLEQVTILRLSDPQVLIELRQQPELARLLGDVVGPTTVLIPSKHVSTVRKILRELGYIDP
jgi:hypothetical protein